MHLSTQRASVRLVHTFPLPRLTIAARSSPYLKRSIIAWQVRHEQKSRASNCRTDATKQSLQGQDGPDVSIQPLSRRHFVSGDRGSCRPDNFNEPSCRRLPTRRTQSTFCVPGLYRCEVLSSSSCRMPRIPERETAGSPTWVRRAVQRAPYGP